MLVRMGNPRPHEMIDGEAVRYTEDPVVFTQSILLGDGGHGIEVGADINRYARQLAASTGMVTSLGPDAEAFLAVTRTWGNHSDGPPSWVSTVPTEGDDPTVVDDFERQLAEFYDCPRDVPTDVEATHWTDNASPPGVDSGKFAAPAEEV